VLVIGGYTPYSSLDSRTKAFIERLYPLQHRHGLMAGKRGAAVVTCALPPGREGLPSACANGMQAISDYMQLVGMEWLGGVPIVGNMPCVNCGEAQCQQSGLKMLHGSNATPASVGVKSLEEDPDTIAALEKLGEIPDREKSIKNFYTYRIDNRDIALIVNSFIAGKPLKLDENIWNLTGSFYENRTIIAGRKKNLRNIARNLLFFKRLFFPKNTEFTKHSYTDRARATFYLINAYKALVKSKNSNIYYRDLRRIYKCIHALTNLNLELDLSHCFGSAFDIDTQYEVEFIRRNFFALQDICKEYYKTHDGPQLESVRTEP